MTRGAFHAWTYYRQLVAVFETGTFLARRWEGAANAAPRAPGRAHEIFYEVRLGAIAHLRTLPPPRLWTPTPPAWPGPPTGRFKAGARQSRCSVFWHDRA
jgi:hypothetical protein